jgi:phosphoglycerate dehydrogenase-like enzyme
VTLLERKILEAKQFQSQDEYARLQMAAFRWAPSVTIGILGLGDIGRGIGRMLRAAGYRVIGFKRRVTAGTATGAGEDDESTELAADRVTDQLDEVLENSDYLVNVLPSTAATRYLLTKEKLDKCRARRPVFMNVGRGDVIAESVLLDELDEKTGAFSFAVLDVFEQEPLPKESALYQHPRVLLTPHVSGMVFPEDVGDLFAKNLDRYLEGKRVTYAVDWSLGY